MMTDTKTNYLLLTFAAVLVVFISYKALTTNLSDPPVPCDQDRPSEPDIVGDLRVNSISSVRPHIMIVRDVNIDEYDLSEDELIDFYVKEIGNNIPVLQSSEAFFSFAVNDHSGPHFRSREYGRVRRLVALAICNSDNSEARLCRSMSVPFYGADRNPLCDVSQAVKIFFQD